MADEWRETTLDRLGHIVTGKTPYSGHPEYFGGDIPFVTPTDLDGRRRIESTERCLTEQGAIAVSGACIPSEAIMVSCIGSDMGKAAIAKNACVTNQQINSIIVESDNSPLFVYYNLSTRKEEIRAAAGGSAQPILNKSAFGQLDILLPPLPEQRAIAHILGTLDGKIELNRRMNQTLEAMARALFKSWFVDFDPVRAKMEGRDPGLPQDLADLFPDRLVDSELGNVPHGWSVASIGEISEVIDCLHSKKPGRTAEGKPLLQLWNIRDDGLTDMSDTYFIDEADYERWTSRIEVRQGDCVITNVGRVGAVSQIPPKLNAALGRNMTAVRCTVGFKLPTFLIEVLLSDAMRREIEIRTDSGTILSALNVRSIPKLRFVRAPKLVLETYERIARPVRARMEANLEASRTLSALRDTLLPKLISGEIRIRNADKQTEAIV